MLSYSNCRVAALAHTRPAAGSKFIDQCFSRTSPHPITTGTQGRIGLDQALFFLSVLLAFPDSSLRCCLVGDVKDTSSSCPLFFLFFFIFACCFSIFKPRIVAFVPLCVSIVYTTPTQSWLHGAEVRSVRATNARPAAGARRTGKGGRPRGARARRTSRTARRVSDAFQLGVMFCC